VAKKEKCPNCGGVEFSIADGAHAQRYCQAKGCKHIWKPLSNIELEVHELRRELNALKRENGELSKLLTEANKKLIKMEVRDEEAGSGKARAV